MKMRYAGLVVCMWCLLWGQETPKKQHSPASTASNHASDPAKIVPPPSTVVNPSVAAPQSQPATANAQQQTQTDPSIWFLRPEWVIVWVTLVYTILTYFTLRTIKRQADLMGDQLTDARKDSADSAKTTAETLKAMQEQAKFLLLQANHMVDHKLVMIESLNAARKSADAALLNAKALISAERPWVFAFVRPFPVDTTMFKIVAKNKGRTPGLILESSIGFVVCKTLNDLPSSAPYTRDTLVRDGILLPNRSTLVFGLNRKGLKAALGENFPRFPEDGKIFIVGRITYRDLLNPDESQVHETRWISWYQPGEEGDNVHAVEGVGLSAEYERYT